MIKVLVTGAGGFIGNHLVNYLKDKGYWVRGVDIKYPQFSKSRADEFELLDLIYQAAAYKSMYNGIEEVYALAADMGGMGYIASNNAKILHTNTLIDFNTLEAAREYKIKKYLYASSACVYPEFLQIYNDYIGSNANANGLREEDVYPAQPQDAYGWEKLITERLCTHYREDYGMNTKIVRFHNIFGPYGTYDGGREKVPAALCRKIAISKLINDSALEIWGDGEQTRSFCYIDDCIEGIYKLMQSDYNQPLNLGQDRMISINNLADIIARIAGVFPIEKKYIDGPQGVRGRNSDNTRLKEVLKWEPQISLEEGLKQTYTWIEKQISSSI